MDGLGLNLQILYRESISAKVVGTSPSCIGRFLSIAFLFNDFSIAEIKRLKVIGLLLPMFRSLNGAKAFDSFGLVGALILSAE